MEIVNSEIILEKSGRASTTDLLECDFPSGRSLALSQGKEFESKGVQHQVSEPKRLRDEAKRLRKGWLKACDNWNLAWWKMNQLEQGPMTFASSQVLSSRFAHAEKLGVIVPSSWQLYDGYA